MDLATMIILAIVQGITEFLPISSDGHLVVANALLEEFRPGYHQQNMLEVTIALHLGTLLSIVIMYWNRLWKLLGADRRVLPMIIIGTIPAVLVGLPLKKLAPEMLESTLLAGLMLPVSALMLIIASWKKPGDEEYTQITWKQALVIGAFQAFAILPGASRSGSTIAAGILVGLSRGSSATFSFLLAVPAIAGAVVLETLDIFEAGGTTTSPNLLIIGAVVSFVVGLVALWTLIRMVERGRLYFFAYWLIPLGVAVTIWQLLK